MILILINSDRRSFSQLLSGAMLSLVELHDRRPVDSGGDMRRNNGGCGGGNVDFWFNSNGRPGSLVVSQSSMFTIPPEMSPASLLILIGKDRSDVDLVFFVLFSLFSFLFCLAIDWTWVMESIKDQNKGDGFIGSFDVDGIHSRMNRLKEVDAGRNSNPDVNLRKPIRGL
ncbi:hypothetical protein Tco_0336854, partial [Tanacetum coccineum]